MFNNSPNLMFVYSQRVELTQHHHVIIAAITVKATTISVLTTAKAVPLHAKKALEGRDV
jgi:hypothetical protein